MLCQRWHFPIVEGNREKEGYSGPVLSQSIHWGTTSPWSIPHVNRIHVIQPTSRASVTVVSC